MARNRPKLLGDPQKRIQGFMQHGLQQAAAVGLSGSELDFELVAQGHQFVHPGDDAVLFGERGEGNRKTLSQFEP